LEYNNTKRREQDREARRRTGANDVDMEDAPPVLAGASLAAAAAAAEPVTMRCRMTKKKTSEDAPEKEKTPKRKTRSADAASSASAAASATPIDKAKAPKAASPSASDEETAKQSTRKLKKSKAEHPSATLGAASRTTGASSALALDPLGDLSSDSSGARGKSLDTSDSDLEYKEGRMPHTKYGIPYYYMLKPEQRQAARTCRRQLKEWALEPQARRYKRALADMDVYRATAKGNHEDERKALTKQEHADAKENGGIYHFDLLPDDMKARARRYAAERKRLAQDDSVEGQRRFLKVMTFFERLQQLADRIAHLGPSSVAHLPGTTARHREERAKERAIRDAEVEAKVMDRQKRRRAAAANKCQAMQDLPCDPALYAQVSPGATPTDLQLQLLREEAKARAAATVRGNQREIDASNGD